MLSIGSITGLLTTISIYVACYLVGSINFSLLAGQLFAQKDIRETGSKNAGATNLARTTSPKIALAVLVLDITRAFLVIWGCGFIPMEIHWPFIAIPLLLGNLWPIFHRFKGGKGIAMSIGIVFAMHPLTGAMSLAAFLLTIGVFKKVSLGSLTFLVCTTAGLFVFGSPTLGWTGLLISALGLFSHRENIKRLLTGQEPRFSFKKNP